MKVKKAGLRDGSFSDSENTDLENLDEYDKTKHDALILEHCPKVFSQIRAIDDITDEEFEKYCSC